MAKKKGPDTRKDPPITSIVAEPDKECAEQLEQLQRYPTNAATRRLILKRINIMSDEYYQKAIVTFTNRK